MRVFSKLGNEQCLIVKGKALGLPLDMVSWDPSFFFFSGTVQFHSHRQPPQVPNANVSAPSKGSMISVLREPLKKSTTNSNILTLKK